MIIVEPKIEPGEAPAAVMVIAESCAAPANTAIDRNCAWYGEKPASIAKAPVNTPHGTTEIDKGMMAKMACHVSWRGDTTELHIYLRVKILKSGFKK